MVFIVLDDMVIDKKTGVKSWVLKLIILIKKINSRSVLKYL